MLLRQPTTPEMLHVLTEELADAHERTREMAYLLMHQEMTDDRSDAPEGVAAPAGRLPEKCYDILIAFPLLGVGNAFICQTYTFEPAKGAL